MVTNILLLILLIGVPAAWILRGRMEEKRRANARARFFATFTGVYPVFPQTPWDDGLEDVANEIRRGFLAHGNALPRKVVTYAYNNVLDEGSTLALDYTNAMVMSVRDYLRRLEEFHAEQARKNGDAARQHFGGQAGEWETVKNRN